jgi:hypothetical protein
MSERQEQPQERCPTCGSGDPKACDRDFGSAGKHPHRHGDYPNCCPDPFHQPQKRDWRCHPDCCPDGSPRCADDPYEAASQEREDAPARARRWTLTGMRRVGPPEDYMWEMPSIEPTLRDETVEVVEAAQLEQALERADELLIASLTDSAGGPAVKPGCGENIIEAERILRTARQQLEGGAG